MTNIFIMCPGVGHIGRGYESFSRELFDELKGELDLKVTLIKGAGQEGVGEYTASCIKRTSSIAAKLGSAVGQSAYHIEQITYFLSSLPRLLFQKPTVIVYSDFYLGVLLWYLRKFTHLRYKLLFSNGAPNGPPFTRCDYVQQLLPFYKEQAVKVGENPDRHIVLPYAIDIPSHTLLSIDEKRSVKKKLDIEQEKVILCVAAINDSHKRISYLIEEVKSLEDPSLCLVVLGQQNEESPAIIQKGKVALGERFIAKTVEKEELDSYYKAADLFVLPSLSEGLPRVMLEALSYGLPVLSHDYEVSRNVLGGFGSYTDYRKKNSLKNQLEEVWKDTSLFDKEEHAEARLAYVQRHFSWKSLKSQYKEMILKVAQEKK